MPSVAACLVSTVLVCGLPNVGGAPAGLHARSMLHPIHTTITTLRYDQTTTMATAEIRIFYDDLTRAVAERSSMAALRGHELESPGADSALFRYIAARFAITRPDGRPVALRPCGVHSSADLRWICLQTPLPGGLAGIRIVNSLLTDLYSDQVNVVMAEDTGTHTRASLLFTRGDKWKALTP